MTTGASDNQSNPDQQLEYHLIFDTNVILSAKWTQDHNEIAKFKSSFGADSRLTLELVLFEPVYKEWRKRYDERVGQALERRERDADTLNTLVGTKLAKDDFDTNSLDDKATEYINKTGFKLVEADVTKFPTLDFFERANTQKPPFEGQDKGFKDAVIAVAAKAYVEANPNCKHLILCNDGVFRDYLLESFEAVDNVQIVTNLEEAGGQIKLALSNLDAMLAETARVKFANSETQAGVFYDLDIAELVQQMYLKEYPNPEAASKYARESRGVASIGGIMSGSGMFLIPNAQWRPVNNAVSVIDTNFVKREGTKLYWESTVSLIQTYRLEYSSANMPLGSPGTVEHRLLFSVSWTTDESGDDYFTNPQLSGEPVKIDDGVIYYPSDTFNASMSHLAATNASISGGQSINDGGLLGQLSGIGGVKLSDPNSLSFGAGTNYKSGSILGDITGKIDDGGTTLNL